MGEPPNRLQSAHLYVSIYFLDHRFRRLLQLLNISALLFRLPLGIELANRVGRTSANYRNLIGTGLSIGTVFDDYLGFGGFAGFAPI